MAFTTGEATSCTTLKGRSLSIRSAGILLLILVTVWLVPHRRRVPTSEGGALDVSTHKSVAAYGGHRAAIFSGLPSWIAPRKPPELLIIYVYYETENALENAKFFIKTGLHGSANFIFVLNGDTPQLDDFLPVAENVEIFRRDNKCFDLGSYGDVIRTKELLASRYTKFILLNASVRGPFLPTWSQDCWSTAWLSKISDTMKLQGMTVNCQPMFHVQSMIFGTDMAGLESMVQDGTFNCADSLYPAAQGQEVNAALKIMAHGWEVNGWMTALHGDPSYEDRVNCKNYGNNDHTSEGQYFGFDLHPYETMFVKANRNLNPIMVGNLTKWHLGMNYSSYDRC